MSRMTELAQVKHLTNFGGDGPTIHLAHANGFPPGAYRQFARQLTSSYSVVALPARPLWPDTPPASAPTWRTMAADLIEGLERLETTPIVGVGHSLGGVLTLWSAIWRPDLFRAVVLIDPVILPASLLRVLRLARAMGQKERLPLVQGALRRRNSWPSRQACFDHYQGKPLFAQWPETVLKDYVEAGTQGGDDGQFELSYSREWEAHIFATVPVDIWADVPRLPAPALIIRGEHSDTFTPAAQARMERVLPRACFAEIPGVGHLAPMERPRETARPILEFLASIPSSSLIETVSQ